MEHNFTKASNVVSVTVGAIVCMVLMPAESREEEHLDFEFLHYGPVNEYSKLYEAWLQGVSDNMEELAASTLNALENFSGRQFLGRFLDLSVRSGLDMQFANELNERIESALFQRFYIAREPERFYRKSDRWINKLRFRVLAGIIRRSPAFSNLTIG